MSFSGDVKRELGEHFSSARHCMLAELSAIFSHCGRYTLDPPRIEIKTENEIPFKKVFTLLQKTFNIKITIPVDTAEAGTSYVGVIDTPAHVYTVLLALGLIHKEEETWVSNPTDPKLVSRTCCRKAYIRGAFLGGGSMIDPNKTYHMEIVHDQIEKAELLRELLHSFDVESHIIERNRSSRSVYVLYLKDGSQIVDVLNIMGGHVALMNLENIRIMKEMRNQINRQVNCEAANLDRVVSAAVKQLQDIQYVIDRVGLDQLPPALAEIAMARIEHEDASLKELGEMLDPPVGKSGVNHRLRKLSAMAEDLRSHAAGSGIEEESE